MNYQSYRQSGLDKEQKELNKKLDELVRSLDGLTGEARATKEQDIKNTEKELRSIELQQKAMKVLNQTIINANKKLESIMDNYIKTQESMAYNLNGSALKFQDISSDLTKAIAGSGIVRQEKVYENLSKLVSQGIVNNVEQRAYLQTLSDDLGMIFDATNGTLSKLIRLQQSDLSAHRMAIEASLKEFLNTEFRTSEYIREGFQKVSENLFEAQSLMSSASAMSMEATIQK